MQTLVNERTEQIAPVESSRSARVSTPLAEALDRLRQPLSQLLAPPDHTSRSHPRLRFVILSGLSVFLIAIGVRLLSLQDNYAQLARDGDWMPDIARHYESEARRYLEEGRILYPRDPVDPGDARLILHPPGYSAMIASIFGLWGDSESRIRLVQIAADALSVVLVLLIAMQLLPFEVSVASATLIALSPHLAFHSLWISPDTICVLPILAAVYLIIRAGKQPRIALAIAAGAMIGVSCWLRANAMMLAPFLAVAVMLLFEKGRRLRYGAAIVIATVVTVSPITIRNWVLFHHFIPISIAGGENLVVGIADFDKEGRFGMPASDREVGIKDAEWFGRPEYRESPWLPDGVERDQARFAKGFAVIRSNPGWFLGVMLQRSLFTLKYNDSAPHPWPFNTSTVPIITGEVPVLHIQASTKDANPIWTGPPSWLDDESVLSKQANRSTVDEGRSVLVRGDDSDFGEQIASPPIALTPDRDYMLTAELSTDPGPIVVKITTLDRRIALASQVVDADSFRAVRKREKHGPALKSSDPKASPPALSLLFASGHNAEARLTISNNGIASAGSVTRIGELRLSDLGPTPYVWTRYPRRLIRGLQRNLFKTSSMLPLTIGGIILLALAGRGRALVVLLAVPVYYICAQSILSTEYRYILAIHYFLFVMAAVTFYCGTVLIREAARKSGAVLSLPIQRPTADGAATRD